CVGIHHAVHDVLLVLRLRVQWRAINSVWLRPNLALPTARVKGRLGLGRGGRGRATPPVVIIDAPRDATPSRDSPRHCSFLAVSPQQTPNGRTRRPRVSPRGVFPAETLRPICELP